MKKKSFAKKLLHQITLNKLIAKDNIKELNEQEDLKNKKLDIPRVDEIKFQEVDNAKNQTNEIKESLVENTEAIKTPHQLTKTIEEKTEAALEKELDEHLAKTKKYNIDAQLTLTTEKTTKPNPKNEKEETPHYHGHRSRLKQRIMQNGPVDLKDYELLEALLMYSIPRSETKPLAKKLLEHFNSFQSIFLTDKEKLKQVKGISDSTVSFFSVIHEVACRMAREEILNQVLLNTPEKVINYCRLRMSGLAYEQFYVLFLNRKNKLILDEVIQSGTIDKAAIFPRELVKRAIDLGAGAMILVHNHPSGDPTPSKADIESTINIQKAASLMEIFLYDHLIIGKNTHYSMRSNKLL